DERWQRGRVNALGVVLGTPREEARGPGRRVLRALPFIRVRQEENEAARTVPLRFTRCEELIDDDLGAVDEVAELGFPDHEAGGVVERVAELEAENRGLGERTVVDLEGCLLRIEVGE